MGMGTPERTMQTLCYAMREEDWSLYSACYVTEIRQPLEKALATGDEYAILGAFGGAAVAARLARSLTVIALRPTGVDEVDVEVAVEGWDGESMIQRMRVEGDAWRISGNTRSGDL